ncbi:MAG: hypothetical protein ACI3Y0_05290 [Prevotella sp.]
MKRKILSMFLLGVMMITSASMFVSCKDYDDDISENKSSINALQEQVNTLKTALEKAQSDATAANSALETLKQTVGSNTTAVAEASAAAAAAMAKAEAVEDALDEAKSLMATALNGKANQSDLDALATKVAGIDTRLVTVEGKVTANEAAIGNLKTQVQALEYLKQLYPAGSKSISEIVTALENAQDAIGDWTDEKTIAQKMNEMSTLLDTFTSKINVLTYLIERQLTSIVLKPDFYYGGIEGVEVPALRDYAPWKQTVDGKLGTKDEQWTQETAADKKCTIEQGGIAQYHINPTSANLVGYKLDFFGNAAGVRSGEQFATPKTKEATEAYLTENFKDGILSVPFDIDYAKISGLAADKLPMIALQMSKAAENGKDTVVTSDYAMILNTNYSNLIIADKKYATAQGVDHDKANYSTGNTNGYHLWGNESGEYVAAMVGTVDTKVATHQVAYNESLDLTKFVEVHYTYSYTASDGSAENKPDEVMSRNIMKALGLKLKYDYIDYTMGTNETSETVHMTLSNGSTGENGRVTPNGINADGSRNSSATNSRVAIGRLPIVRVSLVDADDHVLKVAYIKIEITDANLPIKEFNFDMKDIYADCEAVAETKKWNDIEYTIYTALGMSKAEFEAYYTIDGTLTDLNQYYAKDNNKDEGSYVQTVAATTSVLWSDFQKEKFGTFAEVQDPNDPTTNVLKWSFTADEITRLYNIKDGDNYIIDRTTGLNTKAIERFVKFSDASGRAKIFVKFTIPVGKIHFAVGEPGKKIPAYWFGLNGYTEQANGMEVHINTVVPNTQSDDCSFNKKITDFFQENKVVFGFDSNFANFIAETADFYFTTPAIAKGNAVFNADDDGTWTVKGVSGIEYTLAVATDAKSIQATKADGTALSAVKNVVKLANDGVTLQWGDNEVAKDILNYKGRTGAAASQQSLGDRESFTAYLMVEVEKCYKAFIKNPYINARYLRPVNLGMTEGKTIQDAVDGGSKIDIMDLVTLHDWRWYDFAHQGDDYDAIADANSSYSAPHYINYYGVKLYAKTAEAVTDLDKAEAERVLIEDPSALAKVSVVNPSLSLAVDNSNDGTVKADEDAGGAYAGTLSGNNIVYTNNSGVVNDFHIYVPVYITYKWGAGWDKCQKVWGVITVKKTVNTGE